MDITFDYLGNFFWLMFRGTPFYVWFILVYVLVIGIKSTKDNAIDISYLPRFLIFPIIFLFLKYKVFLQKEFIGAIFLSSISSFFLNSNRIKVIKNSKLIEVPGSYLTLIISLSFFMIKYYFGYLAAVHQDLFYKYAIYETSVSGLVIGYFFGRFVRYSYEYFKT